MHLKEGGHMTDRELLEAILKKVEAIDTKLDNVTLQVVKNSEDLNLLQTTVNTVVTQTAKNTKLQATVDSTTAKIEALETDMKLVKKIISS